MLSVEKKGWLKSKLPLAVGALAATCVATAFVRLAIGNTTTSGSIMEQAAADEGTDLSEDQWGADEGTDLSLRSDTCANNLLLEWQLFRGSQELQYGASANNLVLKGTTANAQYTADGLELRNHNVWAETGLLALPCGVSELSARTIEVVARLKDIPWANSQYSDQAMAVVSLDSKYDASGGYTHVAFDGIMYNEAHTNQFEIGHEGNWNEGAHTGHAEFEMHVWRHLVLTQAADSGEALYVDGVLTEWYGNALNTLKASENKLLFGLRHTNCNYAACMFDGTIREARLYNKVMSATDVMNLFRFNGLLLEWQLYNGAVNGPKEVLHGDAQNSLVMKGNSANGHYTSEGLQFTWQDTWAETGLLKLPYGLSQLKGRTIEVIAKIYELYDVSAIISLDGKYTATGGYTHVAFDGIMYNEANTRQFEMGHEGNVNEGTHTGFAETKANEWRHLVLTQGATTEKLYVDGVLTESVSTNDGPDLLQTIENKLLFGRRHEGCTHVNCMLRGVIKHVRVYGRALSHAQILQIFSSI